MVEQHGPLFVLGVIILIWFVLSIENKIETAKKEIIQEIRLERIEK